MSINIYKQCKIAIKADEGEKKLHTLKMTGPQSWSGINLRVIKNEGEIISDRLMELHHTLGQWASPKRNNNGRTRGTPVISVALGLVRIQHCEAVNRLYSTNEIEISVFSQPVWRVCDQKWVQHWAAIATVWAGFQSERCTGLQLHISGLPVLWIFSTLGR